MKRLPSFLPLIVSLTSLPIAAQQPGPLVIPAQFASAKTIFLGYGGAAALVANESLVRTDIFGGVQASLAQKAHLQMVSTPAKADLLCVISLESQAGEVTNGSSVNTFFLRLAISDPGTHALLWKLDEPISGAFRKAGFVKNVRDTVDKLATDYTSLAAGKLPGA